MLNRYIKWFSIGAIFISLVGCGDGVCCSDNPTPIIKSRAYFIDSPVKGLDYKCDGREFKSDERGLIECLDTNVSFFIGNLKIGELNSFTNNSNIYPQDLVGVSRDNFSDENLIKVVRFLQSLDDDGNIEAYINIVDEFDISQNLLDMNISEIELLLNSIDKVLVDENSAIRHLKGSMNITLDDDIVIEDINRTEDNISEPIIEDINQTEDNISKPTPPINNIVAEAGDNIDGFNDINITLDASNSIGDNIVEYIWSENGNEIGKGINLSYRFNIGVHNILLTIRDNLNNSSSDNLIVNISKRGTPAPPPTADTTAPIVIINGDDNITIEVGSNYIDRGATATDNIDGVVDVETTSTLDTSILGDYIIRYSATDSKGNIGYASRLVRVIDTTAPILRLNGSNPVIVERESEYIDSGAFMENEREDNLTIETNSSLDIDNIGSYNIEYFVVDSSGNRASITRRVIVEDTIAPTITLNGETVVTIEIGDEYIEENATAIDGKDSNISITIDSSLDTSLIGSYTINYTAIDKALNSSSISRVVEVVAIRDGYRVKKTNQTISYDENGTIINDSSLKDDGFYQKGIDNNYHRDNKIKIVIDNITGLIWQDNENVEKDWNEASLYCDNLTLGDYNDWRLPTRVELNSIVDYGRDGIAIDSKFQNISAYNYWSSTNLANDNNSLWVINFQDGYQYHYTKGYTLNVRCVRGESNIKESNLSNNNGIISDSTTKLDWQDKYDNSIIKTASWQNAINYCEELNINNKSDWRLPNINELTSIMNENLSNPAIGSEFNMKSSNEFWSSSTYSQTDGWYIDFLDGHQYMTTKMSELYVRCVRDN
ncbi:hypothetical protein MNB_SV-15-748 [hydrothermal vent metagenome]|uniref:Chitinase n=1 Tax=hydrothermal vent metagenome TaxID=652676 RepID=A0A1W1EK24_9ZZZZ